MNTILAVVLGVALVYVAWWWFVGRNVPEVQPLRIDDDDPLMFEAVDKARASIPDMRQYFAQSSAHMRVKIPLVTSSGTTENLWAELLSLDEAEMEVHYLTPPVTHTGRLERVHKHPVAELKDWVFTRDKGHYRGGFSMRVMFIRGREAWGDLPPQVKAEERNYAGSGS